MKEIVVNFRLADSEYLTALRLVAGAVCSANDIDVDVLEDFKVCVTECANILKNCGYAGGNFSFSQSGGVTFCASGEGGKPVSADNELSLALISALVETCDISQNRGVINKIILKI